MSARLTGAASVVNGPKLVLSPRTRLALEAMLGFGSALYVRVDVDGTEEGAPREPWHPKPGSGAIVHDCVDAPCPLHIGRRIVQRLRRFGIAWDRDKRAEVVWPADHNRLRALLDGRDILWLGSPQFAGRQALAHPDAGGGK